MYAEIIVTVSALTLGVVEYVGLLVEGAGAYPSFLFLTKVVRSHHISEIVNNGKLDFVRSGL